jgi:hypothetical protein
MNAKKAAISCFAFIVFSFGGSLSSQNIKDNIAQLDQIPKFYKTWARLYANDLFRSVYPGQSTLTFGGSQMLSPSAFALEIRGGVISRFPNSIANETYKELDSFKNITYDVINSRKALRFKQYNEVLIPEEEIFFTVFNDNDVPMNSTQNGGDSARWRLPSLNQLGLTESIAPQITATLRWAPGYAFELAGTYLLYNSSPLTTSGNVVNNRNRFYHINLAHDILYWFQKYHVKGWHLTINAGLSNWNQSINLTPDASPFRNYSIENTKVSFFSNLSRIDVFNRTTQYGIKVGKSWHDVEVYGGIDYLFSFGGLSDDGFVNAQFDDAEPGYNYRRYREFFFSGISNHQLYNTHVGAMLGQKSIRVCAQYNVLSNGTQQASICVKYVFHDNEKHPWQLDKPEEMFFDPNKKQIKTKTVIMVREEIDGEYKERK